MTPRGYADDALSDMQDGPVPGVPAAPHPPGGHVRMTSGTTGQYETIRWNMQAETSTVGRLPLAPG